MYAQILFDQTFFFCSVPNQSSCIIPVSFLTHEQKPDTVGLSGQEFCDTIITSYSIHFGFNVHKWSDLFYLDKDQYFQNSSSYLKK